MLKLEHLVRIDPTLLYTLPVLQRHCGFGRAAIDAARRNGLVSHRAGKRAFVLGSDFIYWVINQSERGDEGAPAAQPPPVVLNKTLLTRTEAAEYLGIQPQILAVWAMSGKGRRIVKLGRAVLTASRIWRASCGRVGWPARNQAGLMGGV